MEVLIKKKLLILYTKNPDEVYNRRSAIGSYVHCLGKLLSKTYDVTINYHPINYEPTESETSKQTNRFHKIKSLFPKYLRDFIKDKKHLKSLEKMTNRISNGVRNFDSILEFYNFGSSVGLDLSRRFNCDLHLIYDGPILEEYIFFNGHRTFFEKFCQFQERKSFDHAKTIVVYSDAMKEFCIKNIARSACYKIHQNIDFTRFHFFEESKEAEVNLNICFVGSFLKWHRVDILIRTFHKLNEEKKTNHAQLYLVGDGLERKSSEQLVKELDVKNVHFTGYLDHIQLFELQKKMHLGIMPSSNWYGAPNKIFEYGAMNMACIVPKTKTIEFLFSEKEVVFFQNNNADSFYQQLSRLVCDKPLRLQLAKNLLQFVKMNYSSEKTQTFYLNFLDSSLHN